jgi:hypothetical protein
MANNLWGDLSSLETVRTPKAILQEQADLLTKATGGLLVGKVYDLFSLAGKGRFRYDLDVVVPALNNYRYTVLTVDHPLELYPLVLSTDRSPGAVTLATAEEFEAQLAKILGAPELRSALSHLVSQVSKPKP